MSFLPGYPDEEALVNARTAYWRQAIDDFDLYGSEVTSDLVNGLLYPLDYSIKEASKDMHVPSLLECWQHEVIEILLFQGLL